MVVWIMLAYSCWFSYMDTHAHTYTHARARARTHTVTSAHRRVRRTRIRSVHVRGRPRRRDPTSAVYTGGSRCRCFRSQATRARSSRVTTPSIHQFIIHLMTTHHIRARVSFPSACILYAFLSRDRTSF